MINELTKEQIALQAVVRDEWIKFCLGGDTSIDREKAKQGIEWIYSLKKLPPPKFIAFAEGPLAAQMIANVFPDVCKVVRVKPDSVKASVRASVVASVRDSVKDSVGASVRDSVWAPVWASVRDSVKDSVWASVRDSVWASVGDSVGASVGDSVRASVGASVGDSVKDSVRASVRASVWASVWASVKDSVRDSVWKSKYEIPLWTLSDSGWIAFFDYFMRIGLRHELFEKYRDWLKSGHWETLLFKDLAVIVCRPSGIKKDQQGRLHCESGPAAKWPSGEVYWFWHGARVTEQIILHPETITREQIMEEKNSEVSRAIAEKLGWDEYMKRADTVLVHKWFDESKSNHYELWDFRKRYELTPRLLKMESPALNDGARPYYIEPVPPRAQTCQSARRWQCDPSRPEIDECNKNPELAFEIEA